MIYWEKDGALFRQPEEGFSDAEVYCGDGQYKEYPRVGTLRQKGRRIGRDEFERLKNQEDAIRTRDE